MLHVYNKVVLKSDKFIVSGAKPGDIGRIVENHEDGTFEVQFEDEKGNVYAHIVIVEADVQLVPKR